MGKLLFQVSEVCLVVSLFEFIVLDLLLNLLRFLISLPLAPSIHELLDFPEYLISLVVLRIVHSLEASCDRRFGALRKQTTTVATPLIIV
jgi:hypothetical protein